MPPDLTAEPAASQIDALVARARALVADDQRRILGITGPPGAGKSTLAVAIAAAIGTRAALVGMDGFHLANAELERLGRRGRKGAPDTFDAAGYLALLQRLARGGSGELVYAPQFDRGLEEALAGAVPVGPEVRLVVTEGNYLLLREPPWGRVAELLAECWYVDVPDDLRLRRLVARHVDSGKLPEQATRWALGSDESNAALIRATRDRADLVVRLPDGNPVATGATLGG